MPSASSASSSHSSAAATLGPLSLSSDVASPPMYVRHRPSASSYLSPSRRCSRPQGFQQLQSGQSSNCISNIYCTVDHRVKNSSLEKYLYHALCNDSYPNAKNNRFLFAVEISEEIYGRFVYHFQFIFAGSAETARLGQAKEETERDSRASCQTEADFQGSSLRAFDHLYSWHFNFQTSSDSGANVKRLEQETNIKIEQLKQQMLEHASVFLTRIAESFASSPEKLDQLCNHG
uniref:Uncharacterized protein n=1 Tax=Triticum aestivum TaxID=4565 RepID=A0A3B5Y5U8_WHEAT